MNHSRFRQMNCATAQALDVLGDWWTLLIIREAFLGTRRFADFEENLGIAKNILSRRLQHLVKMEIFDKVDAGTRGQRFEYQFTDRGRDLLTLVTALRQWANKWVFGEGCEPLIVKDSKTGRRVPNISLCDDCGNPLSLDELLFEPGPGANEATRARLGKGIQGPLS